MTAGLLKIKKTAESIHNMTICNRPSVMTEGECSLVGTNNWSLIL